LHEIERQRPMSRAWALASVTLATLAVAGPASAAPPNLARYVNPFAGTRQTRRTLHFGKVFPGATMPFGMIQWSPDLNSRGYLYRTAAEGPGQIQGFSLTHTSGAGCAIYQDFPFTPTVARIHGSPVRRHGPALDRRFPSPFSHTHEHASPGLYQVQLDPGQPDSINVALTSTARTGLGRFTFPRTRSATMLINAGGSAKPDQLSKARIRSGRREVSGAATSGRFCNQRPLYRVYFDARFSRPFRSHGTWKGGKLRRGATVSRDAVHLRRTPGPSARVGAYVTFNTTHHRVVKARVAVSFVSVANARRNLRAESLGRGFGSIHAQARRRWNGMLGHVRVGGGSGADRRTFYTDLYHLMVAPRTFSDANGQYMGMDDRVHDAGRRVQYADFSGWDVYRSDIPLLAMLLPRRTSDIVSSLLADAKESGCLPKWSLANGQTMEMIGDPADPTIASAAAFGARHFDTEFALQAMMEGATQSCRSPNGDYLERQGLDAYQSHGYIPLEQNLQQGGANSIFGDPDAVYASTATTLEYTTDDFSIAQFAARVRNDGTAYNDFMQRAGNWVKSLNPATGYIQPRRANGAFPHLAPIAKKGFAEGNSAQYTWMVPYDLAGLAAQIGGNRAASRRLDGFLTKLNDVARRNRSPYAVLGNEPSLGSPWVYDWLRRPFKTQRNVRRGIRTLYSSSPGGYPGNDDLGELSSWYLFGALGLYPEVPGVGLFALGSPLFPSVKIRLPHGRLVIKASHASPRHPYVHSLLLDGAPYAKPWISYCALAHGARLHYRLGGRPRRSWGADPQARPPSFDPGTPFPSGECVPANGGS
jgi:predicted alpha-1,2-mannosidase